MTRHGSSRTPGLLAIYLLLASGCDAWTGTIGAPEFFGPAVLDSALGPLRMHLPRWQEKVVFRRADSIMIQYEVYNPGPTDHVYRDVAEYYRFAVIGPHGQRMYPKVVSALLGHGPSQRILLYPGEPGARHTINLACMPYHTYSFEPLFRPREGCDASFRFREPGTYTVIAQRLPTGAFFTPEERATPEERRRLMGDTALSRADTISIRFQPRFRLWRW